MRIMKLNLSNCACGLFLLGAVATSRGQTTWNYFISDAGGGNSLVTWSVTGSLATPPGAVWVTSASSIAVSVNAPGIYAGAYAASGASQLIPTPDGSYFQYDNTSVYTPIASYDAYNAPSGANDSFGLLSPKTRGTLVRCSSTSREPNPHSFRLIIPTSTLELISRSNPDLTLP